VKVIAKKPYKKDGVNGWRYVIDESLYGYFSCIAFDQQKPAWFRVPNSETDEKREKTEAILFGRTCDSLDIIATGQMETLEVGDWLYFPLMGAYTSVTASEFNGFPKPYAIKDNLNLLPSTSMAYSMSDEFHKEHSLKYSNSLKSILM
jgi:diaminopimelate decarboxylase